VSNRDIQGKQEHYLARLGLGSLAGMLGMGAGYAAQFLFSLGVARRLGAEEAGIFFGVHAVTVFAALLARLGLERLSLRDISALDAAGAIGTAKQVAFKRAIIIAIVGVIIGMLLTMANLYLSFLEEASERPRLFGMMMLAIPFLAVSVSSAFFLRAIERVLSGAAAQLLIVYGGGSIFLFLLPGVFDRDIEAVAILFLIVCILAAVFGGFTFHRAAIGGASTVPGPQVSNNWRAPAHMLLVSVMTFLISGADTLLLALLAPAEQVTVYVAASRSILGVSLALVGVNSIAASLLSRAYSRGEFRELHVISRASANWSAQFALIAGFAIISIAPLIFVGFGVDSATGTYIAIVLWAGQLANSSVGPVVLVAQMSENERLVTRVLTLAGLGAVLGYPLLIRGFDAIGAAIVSSICMFFWNAALTVTLRRELGIVTYARNISIVVGIWVVAALTFGALAGAASWWWRPPLFLILVLCTNGLLLKSEDRRMAVDIWHRLTQRQF
jgi:O-antigen/teichoic acid export membrane protein